MSVPVVVNMLSARQIMNTNFNSLHLVGTYGAFGSITRPRYEIVVEGTEDDVITSATQWREYEFKAKPGDLRRMPPQIAPYHLRLDWLMWFAAMGSYQQYPWFVNLVAKFLQGDRDVLSLIRTNPFPNRPPRYIRARLFEYHFTTPRGAQTNAGLGGSAPKQAPTSRLYRLARLAFVGYLKAKAGQLNRHSARQSEAGRFNEAESGSDRTIVPFAQEIAIRTHRAGLKRGLNHFGIAAA